LTWYNTTINGRRRQQKNITRNMELNRQVEEEEEDVELYKKTLFDPL
jgi:hypothetical protein